MLWKPYTILHKNEIALLQKTTTNAPSGWIVIAGTYKGGDAMAIRFADPKRKILVIDSFAGLDKKYKEDFCKGCPSAGAFNSGGLKQYSQNFNKVNILPPDQICKMWISAQNLKKITPRKIAFLWLDLDRYQPTADCLNYFGPMITDNGIIMTHDYSFGHTPGIKKACDNYSKNWTFAYGNIAKLTKNYNDI